MIRGEAGDRGQVGATDEDAETPEDDAAGRGQQVDAPGDGAAQSVVPGRPIGALPGEVEGPVQDEQQEQGGHGQQPVHQTHQRGVHGSADVSGHGAVQGAEDGGQERRGDPDLQGGLAAVHQPAQLVVAGRVGAEPVLGAGRLVGDGEVRGDLVIVRHIAPNAIGTVVVFASFTVADSILTLSFLGYLGLGLQPPHTDWGGMLSTATNYINSGYWWLLYPPGLAIVLVAIAFNFMGDALRDAFEVRLQRQ